MKFIYKIHLTLLLIISLGTIIKTDLPAHCLSSEIEGKWTFHLGQNNGTKDITCGHRSPDINTDHINFKYENYKVVKTIDVYLERPNLVYDSNKQEILGRWTMIYDEGIEFNINEQLFFAFSKYQYTGFFNKPTNKDNSDTPGYENLCGETFLGWFNNQTSKTNWGCFYGLKEGRKITQNNSDASITGNSLHNVVQRNINNSNLNNNNANSAVNNNNILDNFNGALTEDFTIPHSDIYSSSNFLEMEVDMSLKLFEPDLDFVNKINSDNNSLWKAKVHPEFVGKSYLYMKRLLGLSTLLNNKSPNTNEASESYLNTRSIFLESEISSQLKLESKLSNKNKIKSISSLSNLNKGKAEIATKLKTKIQAKNLNRNKSEEKVKIKSKIKNTNANKDKQLIDYSNFNNIVNNYDTKNINAYSNYLTNNLDDILSNDVNNNGMGKDQFSFLSKKEKKHIPNIINKVKNYSNNNINKSQNNSSQNSSGFPSNFDWRDVGGISYDSPIRKQGECGSCYAIAAISVIESRIRIKTNNTKKPILSVSNAISCSRYNQGCEGGYPYLVGKQGREHGFVSEECHRYNEDDSVCKRECFKTKLYKVLDYGYVGDYYGGCSEDAMMKEIYNNGPIVVAINASPELYYYSGGIFTSNVKRTEGEYSKKTKPWEFTNHAVVCVGWGEELINGAIEKYWILKNSWGDIWGDNGYFKLKRGMASVEAQGVFLNPDI